MNIKELIRANKIIKSICPECDTQCSYPSQAGECCEEKDVNSEGQE